MATYKGVCKETGNEETVWFEMIDVSTLANENKYEIGLMCGCSVQKKNGWLNVCSDCNIYDKLKKPAQ